LVSCKPRRRRKKENDMKKRKRTPASSTPISYDDTSHADAWSRFGRKTNKTPPSR
jgi:hypothetical protein